MLTRSAHIVAILTALSAIAGLIVQFTVSLADNPTALATVWSMLRYFTILTNLLVGLAYSRMVLAQQPLPQTWSAALALWIGIVGVIYWTLLDDPDTPRAGADWLANHLLHTLTPLLAVVWWVVFAAKDGLRFVHAGIWLVWPLGYAFYGVGRGLIDGKYPYFFIDLGVLGWGGLMTWVIMLAAGFGIAALVEIALARALSRPALPRPEESAPRDPQSR